MTGLLQSRVSKCHSRTVVQPRKIFLSLGKILRIVCLNSKFIYLTSFSVFLLLIIHTYYVILEVIFTLFLVQNFKTEVLTAQKKTNFRMSAQKLYKFFLIRCWSFIGRGLLPTELS